MTGNFIDLTGGFPKGHPEEQGKYLRSIHQLNKLDVDNETYTIIFPDNLRVVSFLFCRGMFLPSLNSLGIDKFKEKYLFDAAPTVTNCIYDCLKMFTEKEPLEDCELVFIDTGEDD